jgi:6-pyruvoyltetrahydropterin/6-carboxytetrahydropterin synthase
VIIYKQFSFDAAHFLPNVPEGHKCRSLHGHTYHLTIFVEGDVSADTGWVVDFNELKSVVQPVVDRVDHAFLNDIPGLENPTSENFSMWLWNMIKPFLPSLKKIELKETSTSGVIYEGN